MSISRINNEFFLGANGSKTDLPLGGKVEKTAQKINLWACVGGGFGAAISVGIFILFFGKMSGLEFSVIEKTFGALGGTLVALGTFGGVVYYRILEESSEKSVTNTVWSELLELSVDDWSKGDPLPPGWQKHIAAQNIIVSYYNGKEVTIPKGSDYFTYGDPGKVAVGYYGGKRVIGGWLSENG